MFKKYLVPARIDGRPVRAVLVPPKRNDSPPRWLYDKYRRFQPHYQYRNGIMAARFDRMERWRGGQFSGKWVGFYVQHVQGVYGSSTERYVWVFADDCFFELKQFGLREVVRREHVRG